MGWLWASPSPPKPSTPVQDSLSPAKTTPPAASNSNEAVDPEIQKFLSLFAADLGGNKSPSTDTSSSQPPSSTSTSPAASSSSSSGVASWLSLKASSRTIETPPAPPRDALSESLLPTDMSCRQAFDLAWGCNSLGGQWNAVFRNGEMRSCADHWDDFWFCMRTKSYTGQLKADAVRQHYRNKEYAKYYAPGRHSSEDVWEARQHRLPAGGAFTHAIDDASVSDDEWRRQENDRRRKIRDGLGFEAAPSST